MAENLGSLKYQSQQFSTGTCKLYRGWCKMIGQYIFDDRMDKAKQGTGIA